MEELRSSLLLQLCGGGDLMAQKKLPYSYGFENNSLADEGWTVSTGSNGAIYKGNSPHDGDYHFRFKSTGSADTYQYLFSPELPSSVGLNVQFYYYRTGTVNMTFNVGYSTTNTDPGSFTFLETDITVSNTSYNDNILFSHDFNVTNIKYIAIKYTNFTGTWVYLYIDDITISEISSSCTIPTNLSAEATSSTTANISWTAGDSETEWLLYYSKSSTAPEDDLYSGAGVVTDIDETSYTLEGLDDYSTYYIWVRAKCGTEDYSDWTDAASFKTSYIQAIPYSYDFENSNELNHWTIRDTQASTGWSDGIYGVDGSYCFQFYGKLNTICNQYLITPELSGATNGVKVAFKYKWTTTDKKLYVGYSTTADTESFNWGDELSITTSFLSYEHIFPSNTKYIAIKCYTNGTGQVYIDDFSITNSANAFIINGNWNESTKWSAGTVPSSSDNIIIASNVTIPNGYTATANNITIADGSLTIADGGQLICGNSVAATVQKDITASTAKSGEGWYTIASAVANPNISSATNLTTGTYDLYRYNEAATANDQGQILYWENYKAHNSGVGADFTTLENGRGYLYRNGASKTLSFTGNTNVGDVSCCVSNSGGDFAGFNLIGNPYPHNIYKGAGTAIPNSVTSGYELATGFHTLTNEGAWSTGTDNSTAILPGQGIMVEATTAGTITIEDKTSSSSSKYNNEYIRFTVENAEFSDDAYAWFDKGYGLHKIDHRNPVIPMLYIPKDGEDYSIAIMKDNTEAFGLNFKANTTGSYTLKYKAKGNFDYLHVIDRLTGKDTDMLLDGEYSFVGSTQDDEARFIVKLAYKPNYGSSDETVFAYQSGSEIFVSGEGELQIFDVTGRIVSTETINGVKAVSVPAQGVYVFRLVGENVKTQKIVVR